MPTIYKPQKKRNVRPLTDRRAERQDIYNTIIWIKLRKAKIMEQPLCEVCLSNGIVKSAEHVHHIVSFMREKNPLKRKELAYDFDNLLSVCTNCHNEIHNSSKENGI
ncbi:hypothetical protein EZS27_024451 [termite gut metagenome]|uniref:HNH nuclease domain-containing protein n=1 Tax=termite gut metagenome TaxID=433724 RepID=A0A5J4QWY0_9ZZZZ